MTTTTKMVKRQTARSLAYRRLADLFRLPGSELPEVVRDLAAALEHMESEAHGIAASLCEDFKIIGDLQNLEVDFARLFAGPFLLLAPPYGSIYLEGERRIMGNSTVDARSHYLSVGLDLAADFKDAPDHVVVEMEFMHALICREVKAIQCGDRELVSDSLRRQESFFGKHLGVWAPAFAAKVAEHADTTFYRRVAEVTSRFIAEETGAMTGLAVAQGVEANQNPQLPIGRRCSLLPADIPGRKEPEWNLSKPC